MRTLCTAAALSGTMLLAAASARAGQAPLLLPRRIFQSVTTIVSTQQNSFPILCR